MSSLGGIPVNPYSSPDADSLSVLREEMQRPGLEPGTGSRSAI